MREILERVRLVIGLSLFRGGEKYMFDNENEELINILFLENEEEYIKKIKEISEIMTLYTAEDKNHKNYIKFLSMQRSYFMMLKKEKIFQMKK